MNKKKVRIFVDMDGTIADIHSIQNWWERCQSEPDFFEKLLPFQNLIKALFFIKTHYEESIELCSLSAVNDEQKSAKTSKNIWMDMHAVFIEERVFSVIGERKSKSVGGICRTDILLDDYSQNLFEWVEDGGTAIKVKNKINCINGKWKGSIISNQDSVDRIVRKLDEIINPLVKQI